METRFGSVESVLGMKEAGKQCRKEDAHKQCRKEDAHNILC